jgi:hypothetical protein
MSTDNNSSNSNLPDLPLRRKRYKVTEEQFQSLLERRIETKLTESLSFSSDQEKLAFIKPGNIVTFKDKLPGFPRGQIAISKIRRTKTGAIQLVNPFGSESPWFSSEAELLSMIDWEWMAKNIIVKEYE